MTAVDPRPSPLAEPAFAALPGGAWRIWRTVVLRGAGFPLRLVDTLADEELAAAADRAAAAIRGARRDARRRAEADYAAAFDRAAGRVARAVAAVAAGPRFREAVAWQNRALLETCLDRVSATPARDSRARRREGTIAAYLQRYTTKNESIGFFGPIGWASWAAAEERLTVTPGLGLLGRRSVYFETWAIDAVAATLAARPGVVEGIAPRPMPANHLDGDVVHLPVGAPERLDPADAAALRLCDGVRTVRQIAAALAPVPEAEVLDRLHGLEQRGLVCLDLAGPIDARPELLLRRRLLRVPDPRARRAALADLDALTADKDALAAAAGEPAAVAGALDRLNTRFERLTGVGPARLHGQTYAGRTLVYEDATRDVAVRLGPDLLAELGPPLSLVLDSSRWLAERIGRDCLARFAAYFERRLRRTGGDDVPLAALLALATRDLYAASRLPPVAAPAVAELQRRWARLLRVPAGARRHQVAAADIAAAAASAFASPGPAWTGGLTHSPDVMIAAGSADAVNRGDHRFVLGELHTAFNTVESRALVEQSPDRQRLLDLAEAVAGGRRVTVVAPRAWGAVTARTSPPSALLSPHHVYWAVGTDDVSHLPSRPLPVAALRVARGADGLVVRCAATGRVFALAEVLGDHLSGAAVNAFRLLPPAPHTPRVSIDRLVVAREAWRMPARRLGWAFQLDERRRYLQLREWLARHSIPRRAFYSVSIETKPGYVDFASLPLVNVFAAVVRRLARAAPDEPVTVSEMLPGPGEAWLPDADGERYTSELRLVVAEDPADKTGEHPC